MTTVPRVMAAMVTPFDPDGNLDAAAHTTNVSRIAGKGCDGFIVAGSTGEGPYLEAGERGVLVAVTLAAVPDTTVLCGINGESVRQAMAQITEAADAGCAAVMVLTPTSLIRGRDQSVASYYTDLADASPVPIVLYSNPGVTAYELPIRMILDLARHRRIIGIKDSGASIDRITGLAPAYRDGFLVFPGASRILFEANRIGASGAITASGNYAYPLVVGAVEGDEDAQERLTRAAATVEKHGVAGTKHAASAAGLTTGPPRPPLEPVDAAARAEIDHIVAWAQQH